MIEERINYEKPDKVICRDCEKCFGTAIFEIGKGLYVQCIATGLLWRSGDISGDSNEN